MTNLELLLAYKKLNQANSKLVTELASMVIHGAQIQTESIDSHVLLEILQKHNDAVKEINKMFVGESDA